MKTCDLGSTGISKENSNRKSLISFPTFFDASVLDADGVWTWFHIHVVEKAAVPFFGALKALRTKCQRAISRIFSGRALSGCGRHYGRRANH